MKELIEILEIGQSCALDTVSEAILNMQHHWDCFTIDYYNTVVNQYNQLYNDDRINCDTKIDYALTLIRDTPNE